MSPLQTFSEPSARDSSDLIDYKAFGDDAERVQALIEKVPEFMIEQVRELIESLDEGQFNYQSFYNVLSLNIRYHVYYLLIRQLLEDDAFEIRFKKICQIFDALSEEFDFTQKIRAAYNELFMREGQEADARLMLNGFDFLREGQLQ